MKPRFSGLLLLGALVLAGCSVADSVRERVAAGNAPRTHVFASDPRTTFAAARAALNSLGYHFTHGGPAEGLMDALSPVLPGDAGENARQISLHAEFHSAEGGTEVQLNLKEIIEDDSAHLGTATTTPLRDTPLYEVFFHAIQSNLGPPAP